MHLCNLQAFMVCTMQCNLFALQHLLVCTYIAYVSFKGLFHASFVGLCGLCHAFAISCLCNLHACWLVVQCHAFYFKYITLVPMQDCSQMHIRSMHWLSDEHSCALVGLFLDANTSCISHWLSVGVANDSLQMSLSSCISGCSFHV